MQISIWGGWVGQYLQLQLALQVCGDELAVEAAVLDKYFVGALAGDDDACEVDAGDVGFERGRIAYGAAVVRLVQFHAQPLDEVEVGGIADEGEDKVVGQRDRAGGRGQGDVIFGDFGDGGVEVGLDLAVLDAVVDVGQDPVLDVGLHLGAAVGHGVAGALPPQVDRGEVGGV